MYYLWGQLIPLFSTRNVTDIKKFFLDQTIRNHSNVKQTAEEMAYEKDLDDTFSKFFMLVFEVVFNLRRQPRSTPRSRHFGKKSKRRFSLNVNTRTQLDFNNVDKQLPIYGILFLQITRHALFKCSSTVIYQTEYWRDTPGQHMISNQNITVLRRGKSKQ